MSRYSDDDDWDDDEADNSEDVVPCPYCGAEIYEDAQYCSRCDHYISEIDAPPRRKPTWIVIAAWICLAIAVSWIFVVQYCAW